MNAPRQKKFAAIWIQKSATMKGKERIQASCEDFSQLKSPSSSLSHSRFWKNAWRCSGESTLLVRLFFFLITMPLYFCWCFEEEDQSLLPFPSSIWESCDKHELRISIPWPWQARFWWGDREHPSLNFPPGVAPNSLSVLRRQQQLLLWCSTNGSSATDLSYISSSQEL